MRVYLGSDHAGFELKARLIEWLASAGHEPVDCGPHAFVQDDDYPVYVMRAAQGVAGDQGSLGIVRDRAIGGAVAGAIAVGIGFLFTFTDVIIQAGNTVANRRFTFNARINF